MEVYEISARFMRRIQAKEYEPAEAEVTLKANLAEGEDYAALATSLMGTAKTTVIEAGLKSGKATAEATAEAPKNKGGRPPKETLVPPAAKTEAAKPAVEPKPEPTPAPVAAPAAEPDEFGEFETVAPAADEKPMAAKELQEWITAHLQAKKIDTTTVKAILAEFGAARTMDTKEEDRVKIKAKVQAALKA
jgi:hypothetical protein